MQQKPLHFMQSYYIMLSVINMLCFSVAMHNASAASAERSKPEAMRG